VLHLDTHVVAWLFAQDERRLRGPARDRLEAAGTLAVSPMVVLELQYLHEIGRTTLPADRVIRELQAHVGLSVSEEPFPRVIAAACEQTWTRDPFDRLIVGQAIAEEATLLTADRTILEHFAGAVWD